MDSIKKILIRPFCKHRKQTYVRTFLDDYGRGYITRHVWKCQKCGKEICHAAGKR